MNRAKLARLIKSFGAPEAVLGATAAKLSETKGVSDELARAVLSGKLALDLEEEIERIARYQVRIVTFADVDYPENLRTMPEPPALLYCIGDLNETDRYAITVVGTRNTTGYGRSVCEEVAGALADAGLTIVSGLAVGIDSVAHQTALRHGGRTLAVLGNGLLRIYPEENESLAWKIRHDGALLSEYGMKTPPDRYNFPERNDILAGLSLGTIVVEAPAKSGALITARAALEMGRSVYAVPGDVTRANSRGCNELIRDGATAITKGGDVIEDLHDQLADLLERRRAAVVEVMPKPQTESELSFEEAQVVELVNEEARHFDSLYETARQRGVSVDAPRLSTILLQLEIKGLIRQAPGKMFVAEKRRPPENEG